MIEELKLNNDNAKQNMKTLLSLFNSLNLAAKLTESEIINFDIFTTENFKYLLGTNFRINVYNNNEMLFVYRSFDTYDNIVAIKNRLEKLVDNNYDFEIDGSVNPTKYKLIIKFNSFEEGIEQLKTFLDILQLK